MERKNNKLLLPLAKTMRKNMTREERKLWYDFLREYPVKFTRQKILGKYIADFYSAKAKLVIEIDGSQHHTEEGFEYDAARTEFLQEYGLQVVRFTNEDINKHFLEVCEHIGHIVEMTTQEDI